MAFKRRRSYPKSVMTKAALSKTTLTQSHQTPSWLDAVSKDDATASVGLFVPVSPQVTLPT